MRKKNKNIEPLRNKLGEVKKEMLDNRNISCCKKLQNK